MQTPTTRTSLRLVAALAAGALALSACGGDDEAVSSPGAPAEQPAGEAPAGDDPAVDPAAGTMPSGFVASPEERAATLFGATEEHATNIAQESGWSLRVGRIDQESFALTEDYMIDRITVELDTDADGNTVVTVVTIELEGGPQTFTR